MKFKSDIDIDVADRDLALSKLKSVAASIIKNNNPTKHNTGVYFHEIPVDPLSGRASIDYQEAEDRGYIKLDILNVSVYQQIKSEEHLLELMQREPDWDKLYDESYFSKLIHVSGHYNTLISMPEAVSSIPRLAMFLSIIRPAKRHLIGKSWAEVAETIWDKPADDGYYFKKSHAVAYANLVVVHMNLLSQAS